MTRILIFIALVISLFDSPVYAEKNEFITLCYHDIIEGLTDKLDPDQMAVGTDNLVAQFSWLKEHGYNIISLQDILDAQQGKKDLPEKAVLITIDDGYVSVYKYLYPLLKMYNYTAVVAVVGKWLSAKPGETVKYGDRDTKPRSFFLSWEQLKEMQDSGYIEIASHSFDLHHGELGNPQGNIQPAATTRKYYKQARRYETDQEYYKRIKTDLKTNSELIEKHTGYRPRTIVWPYGAHSEWTIEIARELGMPVTMTLKSGRNHLNDIPAIRRILAVSNPTLSDFVYEIEEQKTRQDPIRAIRLNLDDIYSKDKKIFTRNFDRMLDRIKAMKINTVYITAYSDTDHDGYADAVYFPSRYLPTRADILNRVSWQIETRAGDPNRINVHMVMPVSAFKYQHRQLTEKEIIELFGDVAKFSYTEGILFLDEKGEGAEDLLEKLIEKVKYYRSRVKNAALLLSDQRVMNAKNQTQFWPDLQKKYNSFVINVDSGFQTPERHIESILNALPKSNNLKNFVFELQTINKKTGEQIPASILSSEIDFLLQKNALQLSHYPDDVTGNHPPLELIKSKISVNDFPFRN